MNVRLLLIGALVGLLLCALLLYKGCMNSKLERASPYTASPSLTESRESGRFVTLLLPEPRSVVIDTMMIAIDTAWIERRCQVHYSFFFVKTYEYLNGFMVAFALQDLSDPQQTIAFESPAIETERFAEQGARTHDQYHYVGFISSYIPDTLRVYCRYQGTVSSTILFLRR